MGDNWRLDKNIQSPDGKLWSPKIFSWKCTFWTFLWRLESNDRAVLCMSQALFFAFESGHFGDKMYPTWNVMKKSICPFVENFSHGNIIHVLSHTSRHVTLLCYIPRTSPSNLSTESQFFRRNTYFMRNRKKTWRLATLWRPMEVVNGKTPFIFISKTSAG